MEENQKRGFWGVIVPMEILDNTDISANEKIVYCYVASYTKMCLDSNERIAERIGVSEHTVTRALKKLSELGYVFIEFVNNDNSKRRIYAIHENPKKLAYLEKKGLLGSFTQPKPNEQSQLTGESEGSFPHSCQNGERDSQNGNSSCQSGKNSCQSGNSQNGGESCQSGNQRIIKNKENKETTEQKPNDTTDRASLAGCGPARSGLGSTRPRRADFESDDDYAEACYNWQTISIGAN